MNFNRYIEEYVNDSDPTDWNILNCLRCLKDNDDLLFTSDSKQDILDAFIKTFNKIKNSSFVQNGAKKKAKKIFDAIKDTFKRREIDEFFEELDREYEIRKTDREVYKSVDTAKVLITEKATTRLRETLEIQERRSNKKRKTEGNVDVEPKPDHDEMDSTGSEYQENSKRPKRKSTKSVNDIDDDNKISDEQMAHFDHIFHDLDPEKMWTLKSGRVVEKVIYEYARNLKNESYIHSFIISDIDEKAKSLFRNEEWEEIFSSNCKKMPKIDRTVTELMKKYSVTDLPSFRKTIFESFLPTNTSYFNREQFDLNYVNLVYRAMHTLWEDDDDFTLDPSRLEGWYQHNIWSPIIDPAFRSSRINLIRGEGMSLASSDRKNDDTSCDADQKKIGKKGDGTSSSDSCDVDRKKIGRKGDGIFRLKGDRLEFGAIEAGRKWEDKNGRKYITDSLKLSKMLRDMLVVLITKCKGNEQIARQLQTVGILHSGNRFQLLIMDVPNGYVCRAQRLDFNEVAGRINDPPLAFVIKDVLRAKAIIMQTLNLVQQGKTPNLDSLDDSDDDNKVERSNRCTTPPPMTLPLTFKTPSTVRTKDVINERKRKK